MSAPGPERHPAHHPVAHQLTGESPRPGAPGSGDLGASASLVPVGWERLLADGETVARYWSHVLQRGPDDCWWWTGGLTDTAHGTFRAGSHTTDTSRVVPAHLFGFRLAHGPDSIPASTTSSAIPATSRRASSRATGFSGPGATTTAMPQLDAVLPVTRWPTCAARPGGRGRSRPPSPLPKDRSRSRPPSPLPLPRATPAAPCRTRSSDRPLTSGPGHPCGAGCVGERLTSEGIARRAAALTTHQSRPRGPPTDAVIVTTLCRRDSPAGLVTITSAQACRRPARVTDHHPAVGSGLTTGGEERPGSGGRAPPPAGEPPHGARPPGRCHRPASVTLRRR